MYALKNNIKVAIVAALSFAFLSVGIFSMGLMRHEDSMMSGFSSVLSCNSTDCGMPVNDFSCLDHCISAVQNFTQIIPTNFGVKQSSFLVLALLLCLLSPLLNKLLVDHKLSKSRLRQLYEKSIIAFSKQLGFWLTLFEKRDPASAFAMA